MTIRLAGKFVLAAALLVVAFLFVRQQLPWTSCLTVHCRTPDGEDPGRLRVWGCKGSTESSLETTRIWSGCRVPLRGPLEGWNTDDWDGSTAASLVVDAEKYGRLRVALVRGEEEVTVTFVEPAFLDVTVKDFAPDRGAVRVSLSENGPNGNCRLRTTDDRGRALLGPVQPGSYSVRAFRRSNPIPTDEGFAGTYGRVTSLPTILDLHSGTNLVTIAREDSK